MNEKTCKLHGSEHFHTRNDGRIVCKKCGVLAVQKRREVVKQKAVEYKGGKCSRCGYDRCVQALSFHHTDPKEKDFGISSKGYTRSWESVKKELDKCILVCHNCHSEIHAEIDSGSIA